MCTHTYIPTYIYNPGDEVEINDDSCGFSSGIHRQFNDIHGCRQYSLHAGCFLYTECEYTVEGSIYHADPTQVNIYICIYIYVRDSYLCMYVCMYICVSIS